MVLALTRAPTSFDDVEEEDDDDGVCSLTGGCAGCVPNTDGGTVDSVVGVVVVAAVVGCLLPKIAVTKLDVTGVCGCCFASGGLELAPVPVLLAPGLPPERNGWVARDGRCDRRPERPIHGTNDGK